MNKIASLKLENQILKKELYNKHIIINNLTRSETRGCYHLLTQNTQERSNQKKTKQ